MGKTKRRCLAVSIFQGDMKIKLMDAQRVAESAMEDPLIRREIVKANSKAITAMRSIPEAKQSETSVAVFLDREKQATESIDQTTRKRLICPVTKILRKTGYVSVTTGDLKAIFDLMFVKSHYLRKT